MSNQLEFDFAICVFSDYDEDDHLGASLDHCGEEKAGAPPAEILMPNGILSRPLDPDVDGKGQPTSGCVGLWMRHGDSQAWMPLKDARTTPKLPRPKKGETIVHNAFGQFLRIDEKKQLTLFTTQDGTNDGQSVYFQTAPDGFRWIAPWGYIKFDATGFHVVTASGARFDLGGISGVPLVGSYASISAGTFNVDASVVSSGPASPTGHQSVALAEPLIALLGQLIAIVGAINATTTGAPALALSAQLAQIQGALKSG